MHSALFLINGEHCITLGKSGISGQMALWKTDSFELQSVFSKLFSSFHCVLAYSQLFFQLDFPNLSLKKGFLSQFGDKIIVVYENAHQTGIGLYDYSQNMGKIR